MWTYVQRDLGTQAVCGRDGGRLGPVSAKDIPHKLKTRLQGMAWDCMNNVGLSFFA